MNAIATRLADLLRPAAYPHPASDVRLIETHISWVLLAGAYVYKLRKPVNFGFLDFTTVEQRQADCEAELTLNRRLCPDLYLDVVNVVERDGQLHFGGTGQFVEPAVQMRRLPEAGMLPELITRGVADDRLMQRLAVQLSDFHASATTGPGVDEHGSLAAVTANWTENFAQTESFIGRTIDRGSFTEVHHAMDVFLEQHGGLIEQRARAGRIRDGHGDLHARSVCLMRRRLYLFDCIEFSARYRCADVAAEVAFLAMDLDHLGRADLGWIFVDTYVRRSHDAGLLALLDFYKCYRAYVRGKVLSFRLYEPGLSAEATTQVTREAQAYFDLARKYTDASPPLLIVTMGLPASGKTTVARVLAQRLGLVHLSSDVVRQRLAGRSSTSHQMEPFERGLYSRATSQRTYAGLRRQAIRWLRRGRGVVLDATYGLPAERAAVRQVARRTGARLLVLHCHAEETLIRSRLAARQQDPDRVSDARIDLWPALRAAFTLPTEWTDVVRLDTSQPLDQAVETVLARVRGSTTAQRAA